MVCQKLRTTLNRLTRPYISEKYGNEIEKIIAETQMMYKSYIEEFPYIGGDSQSLNTESGSGSLGGHCMRLKPRGAELELKLGKRERCGQYFSKFVSL